MSIAYKNALLGQSINVSGTSDTILVNPNNSVNITPGGSGVTIPSNLIASSGLFSNLKINNINVAVSGHEHSINDIQNLSYTLTTLSGQAPSTSITSNNLFLWSNFN